MERTHNIVASWVIVELATGKAVLEIYNREWLQLLKTDRFKAVPIQEYLGSLNRPS